MTRGSSSRSHILRLRDVTGRASERLRGQQGGHGYLRREEGEGRKGEVRRVLLKTRLNIAVPLLTSERKGSRPGRGLLAGRSVGRTGGRSGREGERERPIGKNINLSLIMRDTRCSFLCLSLSHTHTLPPSFRRNRFREILRRRHPLGGQRRKGSHQ